MAGVESIPRPYWRYRHGVPIVILVSLGFMALYAHNHHQPFLPPLQGGNGAILLGSWFGFLLAPIFISVCVVVFYNLLVALWVGAARIWIWVAHELGGQRKSD